MNGGGDLPSFAAAHSVMRDSFHSHGSARTTPHGRKTTLHLTSLHANAEQIITALNAATKPGLYLIQRRPALAVDEP